VPTRTNSSKASSVVFVRNESGTRANANRTIAKKPSAAREAEACWERSLIVVGQSTYLPSWAVTIYGASLQVNKERTKEGF